MTQASRSPSNAGLARATLRSGPLEVALSAPRGPLNELITETLQLYDVDWSLSPIRAVALDAQVVASSAGRPSAGGYLECAQMLVDPTPDGLRATTAGGAEVRGRLTATGERWRLRVPAELCDAGRWVEVEDLLSLVVTTGWRRAGWVPLHAAGIAHDGMGVLVCATSGGGKTTFTVGMVRRGWRTLGDDKVLLGAVDGAIVVGGVKHMLNIDPAAAAWFPEVGDLDAEPPYSTWTPKRRVPIRRFWPSAAAHSMQPTHLLVIERRNGMGGIRVERLGTPAAVLGALLRQTVIPRDPAVARLIVGALGQLAQRVDGLRVDVHDDAYSDPRSLDVVEAGLR